MYGYEAETWILASQKTDRQKYLEQLIDYHLIKTEEVKRVFYFKELFT
jgi:hypothetical protein